jgi:hypothetical protein
MIQRIQTVFLFLAVIALVVFNIIPYWQATGQSEGETLRLLSYALQSGKIAEPTYEFGLYSVVAGVAAIAIILLIVEIFSYKNRLKQMRIAIGISFLMSLNLVLMTFLIVDLQSEFEGSFGTGIFVFALAMLLNILARRFIQKDEKLVRSVDRLR